METSHKKKPKKVVAESERNAATLAKKHLFNEQILHTIELTPSQKNLLISAVVKALREQAKEMKNSMVSKIDRTCHVRIEQAKNTDLKYVEKDRVLNIIERS